VREIPPIGATERDRDFAINQLIRGRSNAVTTVTLTANATTTTVALANANASAVPVFVPLTANAAAEMGAGTMYISARTVTGFVITHANNAQTDRTFGFVVMGG
jgi:uncharacterized membrane-anchored protein